VIAIAPGGLDSAARPGGHRWKACRRRGSSPPRRRHRPYFGGHTDLTEAFAGSPSWICSLAGLSQLATDMLIFLPALVLVLSRTSPPTSPLHDPISSAFWCRTGANILLVSIALLGRYSGARRRYRPEVWSPVGACLGNAAFASASRAAPTLESRPLKAIAWRPTCSAYCSMDLL